MTEAAPLPATPALLDGPVTALPGVGAAAARRLAALGVRSVRELLHHLPHRHHDAGEVVDLASVEVGAPATLIGEVVDAGTRPLRPQGRRRRSLTELTVRQAGGAVFRVAYFNQPWLAERLAPGTVAAFSGRVEAFRGQLQLASPRTAVLGHLRTGMDVAEATEALSHQRLLPVYPATGALPADRVADLVARALDAVGPLEEWLDADLLAAEDLPTYDAALRAYHRPADRAELARARRRLVFDELLALQLGLQWRRRRLEAGTVGVDNAPVEDGLGARLLAALPFAPTGAQRRAFDGIAADLAAERPMHRLLQGDVGSGKTLVALWTMLAAVDRGRQAALMAPTALLAEQHLRTLAALLAPLGVNAPGGVRLELLTSATTATERRRILDDLAAGQVQLVVGTHALIEQGVRFADLGVVVIDEQHRFGVSQRVALRQKTAEGDAPVLPDVLVMTATPIPRSLALTVYGDLDVTVLDELPPGRTPVRTTLIDPSQEGRRARLYDHVRREAAEGRRAYVVCPLVEPAEGRAAAGGEDGPAPTAAVTHHAHLAAEVFPDLGVELVHGRLRADAKDAAMRRFRAGEAQVLVATTVIEVGVDVPEATIMIVEDAERFGLSQLHQLRGRVGRGADVSDCVLMASQPVEELTPDAQARLEALVATTDGFLLAQRDLDLRGAGELFGRRQSGAPDLVVTDIARDLPILERTRALAAAIVAADPEQDDPARARMHAEVARRFAVDLEELEALETG
ncbi:MAG: ATP-dependent DNA helicase RecG [Nitriliruptoraceae bacterium]